MVQFNYDDLQNNLVKWAKADKNVRALILIGSRARTNPAPDQFSDLDTILFCRQPSPLIESNDWLRNLGPFWFNYLEKHTEKEPEQFALYDNALKIDVLIIGINDSENLQSMLNTFPYRDVLHRGFKVLVDKTGSHSNVIIPPAPTARTLPDQAEFDNYIHQGLMLAVKCIRYLERNDLWRAHTVLNYDLKNNLLTLLEWEALAVNPHTDNWYDGRFINQWGNPEIVPLFPQIFSGYQKEKQWSGLKLFLQVYSDISAKIAEKLGLNFPALEFNRIMTYLTEFENSG